MRTDLTRSHSSFRRATAAVLLMGFTIFSMPLRARADVALNSILPANSATLRQTLVTSIERLFKSFDYRNTFAAEEMRNRRTPHEIHVHSNSAGLAVGQQQQLTALAVDSTGETVDGLGFSWSSNNPTIAEISQSGTIRAWAPGDVEVTASSGSIQGSIRLRVSSVEEKIVPSPQPACCLHLCKYDRGFLQRVQRH